MKELVQVHLTDGITALRCYVNFRPEVRVGSILTLKDYPDPNRKWRVEWMSSLKIKASEINRSWNNNI